MKRIYVVLLMFASMFLLMSNSSCDQTANETTTNSGVQKTTVTLKTDAQGMTVEQHNVRDRIVNDNKPGAIKYLYVISPYSGQTILYSTVKGKVTSSGKRLQPKTVIGDGYREIKANGADNWAVIGGNSFLTNEVIQDDGTFGDSDPYIFWWDVRGVYHQHFMTGGQIMHVADAPLNVKSVVINIEAIAKNESE